MSEKQVDVREIHVVACHSCPYHRVRSGNVAAKQDRICVFPATYKKQILDAECVFFPSWCALPKSA